MAADVSIRLRLIDTASRGFHQFEQRVSEVHHRIEADARRSAAEQVRAGEQGSRQRLNAMRQSARAEEQIIRGSADSHIRIYQQINAARQQLGVRGFSQIRDEINRTRQAYQTLSQSGVMSFREQISAAGRMRSEVTRLTNEMGRLTHGQQAIRVGSALGAGALATGYAVRQPLHNALEYDRRLDYITITAFPERDTKGKQSGAKELNHNIQAAVDASGLDVTGVTDILETMVSGDAIPLKKQLEYLPELAKIAKANNADPAGVAALTNVLASQGKITDVSSLKKAHNIVVAVGQESGFEYKNQVMHLPSQLAASQSAGFNGLKGLRDVATMNATSFLVSGTPDQAGVATHNLLLKLVSKDTAKDFEEYFDEQDQAKAVAQGIKGKGRKPPHTAGYVGRDLYSDLMDAINRGESALDFWQKIIDDVVADNPKLAQLKKELGAAKTTKEQMEKLSAIEAVGKGSAISTFFQEMRGQNAMFGWQNKPYKDKVLKEADRAMRGEFTPSDNNFQFIQQSKTARIDKLDNAYEHSRKSVLDRVTPTIADMADSAVAAEKKHPALSAATGVTSLVGGGAIAAGWMLSRSRAATAGVSGVPPVAQAVGSRIVGSGISVESSAAAGSSSIIAKLESLFMRLPSLLSGTAARVAPYAIQAARVAPGVGQVAAVGFGSFQAGGMLADAINRVISKINSKETTLGSYIYELVNYEPKPVKIDPIQVNAQSNVAVSLSPGLVAAGQKSSVTSNNPTGANVTSDSKTSVGNTGNIWHGAPG